MRSVERVFTNPSIADWGKRVLFTPTLPVDFLIVGGGAGGGNLGGYGGWGGGGGGKVETVNGYLIPKSSTAWSVAIGGAAGQNAAGNASVLTFTPASNFATRYAQTSVGGAAPNSAGGTSGNGFAGGPAGGGGAAGAGGGGAGAVGGNRSGTRGGDGGNGITNNYRTGSAVYYGGGGGGGCQQQSAGPGGSGGAGGGGAGRNDNVGPGNPGTANTGGAGGGGTGGGAGGNGGSGIVVARYLTSDAAGFTVSQTNGTTTTVGSYTVITWLATGTLTVN